MRNKGIPVFLMILLAVAPAAKVFAGDSLPAIDYLMQLDMGRQFIGLDMFDARMVLDFAEEIGLEPGQENRLENLLLDFEERMIRKSGEIKIGELHFASYIRSEKIDRQEIARMIREISRQKTDVIVDFINHLYEVKKILSPGQVKKASAIREELKKKWNNRKHREGPRKGEERGEKK